MAARDHTGRIRPFIPFDVTLVSCSRSLRATRRDAHSHACQLSLTTAIGYG